MSTFLILCVVFVCVMIGISLSFPIVHFVSVFSYDRDSDVKCFLPYDMYKKRN